MAGLDGIRPASFNRLCGLLARQRINLSFLISSQSADNSCSASFCFEQACFGQALDLISNHCETAPAGPALFYRDVAALTLYPRGRGLGLAMGLPAALVAAGSPPLGAGSSLAAAVAVVEGSRLFEALEIIQKVFPLGPGLKLTGERIKVVQEPRR